MEPQSQSAASAGRLSARPDRLTAVLFTDVVDSTTAAVRLGDAAWATLLERHNAIVREAVREHGGAEMDTAGDGLFAVFDDAADALRCARVVREALAPLGLVLRAGVHAGHCWTADGKCAGADVHIGARLAEEAKPREILASEEAAALAAPAGMRFVDAGVVRLKGFTKPRRMFALTSG
ncbi:MAG TPA: adenylate/guanylate cyclase domain-containing protein [Gaiellaceae bacterium]|jgi:class 3 adenylate cyclase|nr:adenylate/guanylate cyclase domain-containing protein [Gaiellaceae bacterium]